MEKKQTVAEDGTSKLESIPEGGLEDAELVELIEQDFDQVINLAEVEEDSRRV